jgi:hypothetical protein
MVAGWTEMAAPLRAARRRALVATGLLSTTSLLACGGTTGLEGLTLSTTTTPDGNADDGGAAVDATVDATVASGVDLDSGEFDVTIYYDEQQLPEVGPPPATGAEAGFPWPDCPSFIPVRGTRPVTNVEQANNWLPAAEDESQGGDAGPVFAADGSACATYPWLGSLAADDCVTHEYHPTTGATGTYFGAPLPPCSWCADAGVAVQGTREGDSRYQICLDLYACIARTNCSASGGATCLCGSESEVACETDPNPPGPCAAEEVAALEELPTDNSDAIQNYNNSTGGSGFTGSCGAALNSVYTLLVDELSTPTAFGGCLPPDGGDGN